MTKEPIVLETSQIHATITSNGICPTLTASMGIGGGYVPMIVVGFDSYNLTVTGDTARCLTTPTGGLNEHIPHVVVGEDEDINRETIL